MLTSRRLAGGLLVLIGAVALWEGLRFPFGTPWRPGPAYMPTLLSLALIAIGAVLALRRDGGRRLAETMDWRAARHAVAVLGVCAFVAVALERLGWRLSVATALLVLLGVVERRGAVFTVVLTVVIALGSFYLFNDLLRVPLPRGPFGI